VRYFGTVDDLLWLMERRGTTRSLSAEVMTHPSPGPGDAVVDAPSADTLAERLHRLRTRFERTHS